MHILFVICPQVDYSTGGAVEVPGIEEHWKKLADKIEVYDQAWVYLEQHPANHVSFAATHPWRKPGQSIPYQSKELKLHITHCVAGTFGAMIYPSLQGINFDKTISFGEDSSIEPISLVNHDLLSSLKKIDAVKISISGVNHGNIIEATIADLQKANYEVILLDQEI